jgi:hypothetical protein
MAQIGKIQFTVVFTANAEHVAEGDRLFQSHAEWMSRTHYRTGDKALLSYNVSKAPEMKDPMDPNSGVTGRTHFVMTEVYESPAGLQDHWEQAQTGWRDWAEFNTWFAKGEFLLVNGSGIFQSLW